MDLADVFSAATLTDDGRVYQVERRRVGVLRIPSGTIVAGDPFEPRAPFTRPIAPGGYPVELAILWLPSRLRPGRRDERVGFARIVLDDGAIVRWELAVTAGEDVTELTRGQSFRYPVDSGTGCFADGALFEARARARAVADALSARRSAGGSPAVIHHSDGAADLIGFTSGDGDGRYPSWFGLDAQGHPMCLVTDFGLGDFARPIANPTPERASAALAARVTALVARARGTSGRWTTDDDRACHQLLAVAEVGEHTAALLGAVGPAAPIPLVRLAWQHAALRPGQQALAAWLERATPASVERLLAVSVTAGTTERASLSPALVSALLDLRDARTVDLAAITRFLYLRGSARWSRWHDLAPIICSALAHGADPEVRVHGLWMAACTNPTPPEVIGLALAALDDPDPLVVGAAAGTVTRVEVPLTALARQLDHRDATVRARVALRLHELRGWQTWRWRKRIAAGLRAAAADLTVDATWRRAVHDARAGSA